MLITARWVADAALSSRRATAKPEVEICRSKGSTGASIGHLSNVTHDPPERLKLLGVYASSSLPTQAEGIDTLQKGALVQDLRYSRRPLPRL